MALLAEQLVEEWLNRQGYFTIRCIKIGVHVDLINVGTEAQKGVSSNDPPSCCALVPRLNNGAVPQSKYAD